MGFEKYKKAILNKISNENEQSFADPMSYFYIFSFLATTFGLTDVKASDRMFRHMSPICIVSAAAATTLFSISESHFIITLKYHLATECGTYMLVYLYQFILISSVMTSKKYYRNLFQALESDFQYTLDKGQKYREKFLDNQRLTFQASFIMTIFTFMMGGGIVAVAILTTTWGLLTMKEGDKRPQSYPIWFFNMDVLASPTYEVIFIVANTFVLIETYFYIFVMQSHILWIRTIASKADLIVWNLQDILADMRPATNNNEFQHQNLVLKHRFRDVILMHQSMILLTEEYAAVFKRCLLYEQMVASPGICLTAFCFVSRAEQGDYEIILLVLCIAIIGVVFIPSFLCTHLLEKTRSVGEAVLDVPFWNVGPITRPYLILLMQRSMRKLPTTASGFDDISLQTYASMITRAYSWFNMLRQANLDFT